MTGRRIESLYDRYNTVLISRKKKREKEEGKRGKKTDKCNVWTVTDLVLKV